MQNAECKINKPSLLIEACKTIEDMKISNQTRIFRETCNEYLIEQAQNLREKWPVSILLDISSA